MKPKANLLEFGEAIDSEMEKIEADLPIGVGIHLVSDQPKIVEEAVGGVTKALFEAVAIVLAGSFVSLGFWAGLVVSLTIPLVLAPNGSKSSQRNLSEPMPLCIYWTLAHRLEDLCSFA